MKSLNNVKTLAIVCTQWGDTGKGKLVDYFGEWADINVRGTGGANAGHTVCIGDKKYVLNLVPSAILHTDKLNVIGNGVVLDPTRLVEELDVLDHEKVSYENLHIAHNAKLVLPQHLLIDRLRESGEGKIGTTGRGIGPAYEDHYRRIGLTVNDLLNVDQFAKKLKKNWDEHAYYIRGRNGDVEIRKILQHKHLNNGQYSHSAKLFNLDAVVNQYMVYGKRLKPYITDTDVLVRKALGEKRILLEGAQGNLLSVDFGSYPYVTSSDCTVYGLAKGAGISPEHIDRTIGIAKAPYMTRVGGGPFPTELGGTRSEEWCGTSGITPDVERQKFPAASLMSADDFELGVAMRQAGGEYGATTGRPRRTGWLDLVLLRYSRDLAGRHGQEIALTKLDVLNFCPTIKICTHYRYTGPDYRYGCLNIESNQVITTAFPSAEILKHCVPVYQEFDGWMSDISGARTRAELPPQLERIIHSIEVLADVKVGLISVGPRRDQTIFE